MIVVTGATGKTGKFVSELLLLEDERVRVIGRSSRKLESLRRKGAEVFVGSLDDIDAMKKAFSGATAAYLMMPFDGGQEDLLSYQSKIVNSYVNAIRQSDISHVVTLSSIGAWNNIDAGPLVSLARMEDKINAISSLNTLHLRSGLLMSDLFMTITPLRANGSLIGTTIPELAIPWIAPKDIAKFASDKLSSLNFSGVSFKEMIGPREIKMSEVASILGKAIGKPSLVYAQLPLEMFQARLLQTDMPKETISLLVEMWGAINCGALQSKQSATSAERQPTTLEAFIEEELAPVILGRTATYKTSKI